MRSMVSPLACDCFSRDLGEAEVVDRRYSSPRQQAVSDQGHRSVYKDEAKVHSLPRLRGSALRRKVAGDPDHVWVKPLA